MNINKLNLIKIITPSALISMLYLKIYNSYMYILKLNPYTEPTPLPAAIKATKSNLFLTYDFNLENEFKPENIKTFDDLGAFEHGPSFLTHLIWLTTKLLNFNIHIDTYTPIHFWFLYLSVVIFIIYISTNNWIQKVSIPIIFLIIFYEIHKLSAPSIGGRSLGGLLIVIFSLCICNFIFSKNRIIKLLMVLILISLGFAPFLREDVYSFYLLVPILIIIILLILFFRDLNRLFSNILLFFISLIPLISYMVIKTFLKLILTNYWNQDFNTIKLINHGSGHSLFLSLGYTDNPFNIAWSDFNGLTQGKILSGNPYFCSFFDSSCLNLLGIKYFELSYNFPFVLLKNIFYKFADFLSFTLNSSFFEQHQFASITNSSRFGKIFILIILLYLFILIIQFYLNNINLNINYLIISSSAVISGMVLPIIIFPTYISIFQGAVIMQIYFISLLLNNSIGVTRLEFVARFNRYLINFFMFSLIFMILAFAYAGLKYRDLKINQNFITTNSLEDSLNRFDYEYAYYFNSLSKNEKNILISKLNINSNLRVKNWSSQFDKSQIYFKSNLAVLIQNRLLVFVFLPEQNFPKISFDQGRFHAGIHICPNCKNVNLDPGFSVMDSPIIFLNDDSWNNEWRVVVFPVDQNIFSKYSNLLVYGLVKNLPKNGTAWGFTFNYTNSTILSTNE